MPQHRFSRRARQPFTYLSCWGSLGTVSNPLRASLSCTFLRTLPELVTPLKGHSLGVYLRAAVHRRSQRPPKGLVVCGSSIAPKHPCKHETHVPWAINKYIYNYKSFSIQTILVSFVLAEAMWSVIKETSDII